MKTNINKAELVSMVEGILLENGLSQKETTMVISHLLEEELMGKASHGFYRLPGIVKVLRNSKSLGVPFVDKENSFSFLFNGSGHLGLAVAQLACDQAKDRAKSTGIALVGVTNYVGTTGAMGYYTRQIAADNLIGICFCTSEYAVAPWGGKDPILGTNPISIGLPSGVTPIVIDFSTAARTYGELMLAVKEKKRVTEGIVLDSNGMSSTDPNDANNGCQLPMAEHKGYGLGLAIEVLSGIFIGAKAGRTAVIGSDGMLFIVFKPDFFVSISQFMSNTECLINEITNSALAYGFSQIRIPGHASWQTYNENKCKTDILINDEVLEEIRDLSK